MNREVAWHPSVPARAQAIVDAICKHFDVEEYDLFGPSKVQHFSRARQAAWMLIRDRLHWTWEEIARVFQRDRTAITEGVNNVRAKMKGDFELARKFKNAMSALDGEPKEARTL